MKQFFLLLLALALLTGCAVPQTNGTAPETAPLSGQSSSPENTQAISYTLDVEPASFHVTLSTTERTLTVSLPGPGREVSGFSQTEAGCTWVYPQEQIQVTLRPEPSYLDCTLTFLGQEESVFSWPLIAPQEYTLPIGQGTGCQRKGIFTRVKIPFWHKSVIRARGNEEKKGFSSAM